MEEDAAAGSPRRSAPGSPIRSPAPPWSHPDPSTCPQHGKGALHPSRAAPAPFLGLLAQPCRRRGPGARPCLFPVPPKMSPCRWASSSAGSLTLAGRGSARGEPWTRQHLG